ncbi:MAG: hypothetical protein ACYC19_03955 [Acidimicrobiales bacterium]
MRMVVTLYAITLASVTSSSLVAGAAHQGDTSPTNTQPGSTELFQADRQGSLFPTVTCVDLTSKNEYTVYFGYTNTGSPVTHPTDSKSNRVSPSSYNGGQPTDFGSGTFTNAFSVLVTSHSVSWTLDKTTVSASSHSTQCSDSSLPADPLGLSLVIALGIGIVVGVIVVTRTARRRRSL